MTRAKTLRWDYPKKIYENRKIIERIRDRYDPDEDVKSGGHQGLALADIISSLEAEEDEIQREFRETRENPNYDNSADLKMMRDTERKYGAFLGDAERLTHGNSYALEYARKNALIKHFPRRFGRGGLQSIGSYDALSTFGLFMGVVKSARDILASGNGRQ